MNGGVSPLFTPQPNPFRGLGFSFERYCGAYCREILEAVVFPPQSLHGGFDAGSYWDSFSEQHPSNSFRNIDRVEN